METSAVKPTVFDELTDEQFEWLTALEKAQETGTLEKVPEAYQDTHEALTDEEFNDLLEATYYDPKYVMSKEEFSDYYKIDQARSVEERVERFKKALPAVGEALSTWWGGLVDDVRNDPLRFYQNVPAGIAEGVKDAYGNFEQLVTGVTERATVLGVAAFAEEKLRAMTGSLRDEDIDKAYNRYLYRKALDKRRDNPQTWIGKQGSGILGFGVGPGSIPADEKVVNEIAAPIEFIADPINYIPFGVGAKTVRAGGLAAAKTLEKGAMKVERAMSATESLQAHIGSKVAEVGQKMSGLNAAEIAKGSTLASGLVSPIAGFATQSPTIGALTALPAIYASTGMILRRVRDASGAIRTVAREAQFGIGAKHMGTELLERFTQNMRIPERYRLQALQGGTERGVENTLHRIATASDVSGNLRVVAKALDRPSVIGAARMTSDAATGSVEGALLGGAMGQFSHDDTASQDSILGLGALLGGAGGAARRFLSKQEIRKAQEDADIARMLLSVEKNQGNTEALAQLPHEDLLKIASLEGLVQHDTDFIPLKAEEYLANRDVLEATAGVSSKGVMVVQSNGRKQVFLNIDEPDFSQNLAHEIGHAVIKSDALNGGNKDAIRAWVSEVYGEEGVKARAKEYAAKLTKESGESALAAQLNRLSQEALNAGEIDPLSWAKDEIFAEHFTDASKILNLNAIRSGIKPGMFLPASVEPILAAIRNALGAVGLKFSDTGAPVSSRRQLFIENPLVINDKAILRRLEDYTRAYSEWINTTLNPDNVRGVKVAPNGRPGQLRHSAGVRLRPDDSGQLVNEFARDVNGRIELKAQSEINQRYNARRKQLEALRRGPLLEQEAPGWGRRKLASGREIVRGNKLPNDADYFATFSPWHREMMRVFEAAQETGSSFEVLYHSIGGRDQGPYRVKNLGNIEAIRREVVPFGWQLSKANNLLAEVVDLTALRAKVRREFDRGSLRHYFPKGIAEFEVDFKIYLSDLHTKGVTVSISPQKRDAINALLGIETILNKKMNGLSELGEFGRGSVLKTIRWDRLEDATPTRINGYFIDYPKLNRNLLPGKVK